MDFEDKVITCGDCGKEFVHTAEDQQRYAERGFTEAPKRCRECRQVRKDKAAAAKSRPRSDRPRGGGRGGPGRSFHGPRFRDEGRGDDARSPHSSHFRGGGPGRGPRPSFAAVCAACGVQTTVPFEPRAGREVFCKDCYKKLKEER
jgi:CxxC-x17-CxxC domain-containing protein